MMFLGNMYFPYSQFPELFLVFRIMVTTMSIRQLQKNLSLFSSDLEQSVRDTDDDPEDQVDQFLFQPIFGKFMRLKRKAKEAKLI